MRLLPILIVMLMVGLVLPLFMTVGSAEYTTPIVWSNKKEYDPSETAYLYGYGFKPSAQVTITIVRPDLVQDLVQTSTDEFGYFSCQYLLDGLHGTFYVTATDGVNVANTTFDNCLYLNAWWKSEDSIYIYAQAGGLSITKQYYIKYFDPAGVEKRKSPTYTGVYSFRDNLTILPTFPNIFGTWTVKLYENGGLKRTKTVCIDRIVWTTDSTYTTLVTSFVQSTTVYFKTMGLKTDKYYRFKLQMPNGTWSYVGSWTTGVTSMIGSYPLPSNAPIGTWKLHVREADNSGGTCERHYVDCYFQVTTAPPPQQYYLTVRTDPPSIGTIPGQGSYNAYTFVNLTAPQYFPGSTGIRYRFNYWDVDGIGQGIGAYEISVHMDAAHTATAHYVTQYFLNLTTSPLGVTTPPGIGWYDTGTNVSIFAPEFVSIVNGASRYRFNGWTTGDMSEIANCSATSTTVRMDKAKTVTANYLTQYFLKVTSPYGTPGGQDWYNNGTKAYATLDVGVVDHLNGTRRVFISWGGDASGTDYTKSNAITMNGPKTATANWKTRYKLTVRTNGLGTKTTNIYNDTTILGTATDATPFTGWFDQNAVIQLNIDSPISGSPTRYVFTQWTGDASGQGRPASITMSSPKDVSANYKTQYQHTITSSPATGSGYITVDGSAVTTPYTTHWWDSGSLHAIAANSPVTIVSGQSQYIYSSWSDSGAQSHSVSPTTVTTYTANFQLQYKFDVSPTYDSPTGAGWYNSSSSVSSTITTPVSGGTGIRYQTTGWTGTGSLSSGGTYGSSSTGSFTINAYSTCTWNWITQYQPTITLTGTTSSLTVSITARTLDGSSNTPSGLYTSWSDWCDDSTSLTFSTSNTGGGSSTERLHTISTVSWTVTSAFSSTITYIHQWKPSITLGGTSSGDTVSITARTLDGSSNTPSGLYTSWSDWCDDSRTLTFSATSTSGKQCRSTTARSWTVSSAFSATPIWDRIKVNSYARSDDRANVNDNVNIDATLVYEYDSSAVTDGTVTINGYSATYQGSGVWRIARTSATVTSVTYNTVAASGNTYGITVVNQNSQSTTVIWDRIDITISANSTTPSAGQTVQFTVSGKYEYDSVAITTLSFQVTRNGTNYATSTPFTDMQTSAIIYHYTTGSASETTYGLSTFSTNTVTVTWSTLTVSITLTTSPAGCNVRLDAGTWYTAPHTYSGIISGSSHTIEAQDPYVVTTNQEQYIWASWSDSGANPHSVSPTSDTTYTATMTHQWYFLASSTYDSPTGTGWYNAGSSCSGSSVTRPVSGGTRIQYETTGWTGTGSLSSGGTAGSSSTGSFTINAYSTCTWNWKTQYLVHYATSGNVLPVTVPADEWVNSGAGATGVFPAQVTDTEIRCNYVSDDRPSVPPGITAPTTVTATYQTQYYLTMSTNFGTVSPVSRWFDAGSVVPISATAPSLVYPVGQEQYVWNCWTGTGTISYNGTANPSSITMNSPINETASWTHQFLLTIKTNGLPSAYPTKVYLGGPQVGTASDSSPYTKWFDAETPTGTIGVDNTVLGATGTQYLFIKWVEDSSTNNPRGSETMNSPKTFTAEYKTQYLVSFTQTGSAVAPTVTYTANTDPTGTVPFGVWVKAGSQITYTYQNIVPGAPGVRYIFTSVTPTSPQTVNGPLTVNGAYKTQYLLTVLTGPAGLSPQPSRNPAGEAGPANGWWYDNTIGVTLTAQTVTGYTFNYWDVDGTSKGSGVNPIPATMNAPHTATAHYTQVITYTLAITATASGTTNPASATYTYSAGITVNVTATPNAGYRFDHWVLNGSNAGSTNPISVLMDRNRSLQAVFAETHTLIISVSEGGTTNPAPGTYTYQTPTDVSVTAIPNVGYRFDHWIYDNNNIGSQNPVTVHVGSSHTLKAVFAPTPPSSPVGGYSILLVKQTPVSHMTAYTMLIALFGVVLSLLKRKRK